MSRIGKKPVPVPSGVDVKINGCDVTVKGPKGELNLTLPAMVQIEFDGGARQVKVSRMNETKQSRANHGLCRSLVANMIQGVTEGFQKRLLIYGTGYNCKLEGRKLHMNVGFMGRNHGKGSQFELPVPDGVEVKVETPAARGDTEPASLMVSGIDKQKVGHFAAEIHGLRKSEPYKGKGIRYEGEHVRRKQGKALAGAG